MDFAVDDATLVFLVIGALLLVMTFSAAFIARLPLSAAMLYLLVGVGIGPAGLELLSLHPFEDAALLERLTEVAVIISLFVAGMKLDIPLRDRRWRVPLQLATLSMLVTVGLVAALGYYALGLSLGAAVLLGAILAPTDPVLASDVQVTNAGDRDCLRFGLTGEGGLNDGTAFPLVMLGLGLLQLHDLGPGAWRWWAVDVLWATLGGLGIGYGLGAVVGVGVQRLRRRHPVSKPGPETDEFIALGLIALVYGVALLCQSYGFLAVFAAGLALGRMERTAGQPPQEVTAASAPATTAATPDPADVRGMMRAVQRFNAQLERFAEVAVVLAVGALLATVTLPAAAWWFVPFLFGLIRPLSIYLGLLGAGPLVDRTQRRLMGWFGIRGIGSVYYLMYAISHGLAGPDAQLLVSLTLAVVVASVVAHGISVTPLMRRYESKRRRLQVWRSSRRPAPPKRLPPR